VISSLQSSQCSNPVRKSIRTRDAIYGLHVSFGRLKFRVPVSFKR
jgi:hypothetical protein